MDKQGYLALDKLQFSIRSTSIALNFYSRITEIYGDSSSGKSFVVNAISEYMTTPDGNYLDEKILIINKSNYLGLDTLEKFSDFISNCTRDVIILDEFEEIETLLSGNNKSQNSKFINVFLESNKQFIIFQQKQEIFHGDAITAYLVHEKNEKNHRFGLEYYL